MKRFHHINKLRYIKNRVHTLYGHGARAWFYYIYYGLFRLNKFMIFRVDLGNSGDAFTEQGDVTYLFPTIDELDLLRSKENLPREFYCDKFQKVSTCCVAKVDGELAYIHWIYFTGDFSRFLKINNYSAEINSVFTLPEFRGRNISTGAFKFTMRQLKLKGVKNMYAVVHEENIASIKSFARAGFIEIGTVFAIGSINMKTKV